MTKRQTIDEIIKLNSSARPEFLVEFSEQELSDYLRQLRSLFSCSDQVLSAGDGGAAWGAGPGPRQSTSTYA